MLAQPCASVPEINFRLFRKVPGTKLWTSVCRQVGQRAQLATGGNGLALLSVSPLPLPSGHRAALAGSHGDHLGSVPPCCPLEASTLAWSVGGGAGRGLLRALGTGRRPPVPSHRCWQLSAAMTSVSVCAQGWSGISMFHGAIPHLAPKMPRWFSDRVFTSRLVPRWSGCLPALSPRLCLLSGEWKGPAGATVGCGGGGTHVGIPARFSLGRRLGLSFQKNGGGHGPGLTGLLGGLSQTDPIQGLACSKAERMLALGMSMSRLRQL